jgi:hypothetical protein
MRGPRRAFVPALAFVIGTSAACNAILGNHDRVLDDLGDAEPGAKDGGKDVFADAATDGTIPLTDGNVSDGDGGPITITIPVPPPYTSPNSAVFGPNGGGTTIYDAGPDANNHPQIVPVTPPAIPSDDYTVSAVVHAPTNTEFGILARFQPNGSCAVLGSMYGGQNTPYVGVMPSTDYNPTTVKMGAIYVYTPNARYNLELKVVGNQAYGTIWETTTSKPAPQVQQTLPWSTGRNVGYYVYYGFDAILESMQVTVP